MSILWQSNYSDNFGSLHHDFLKFAVIWPGTQLGYFWDTFLIKTRTIRSIDIYFTRYYFSETRIQSFRRWSSRRVKLIEYIFIIKINCRIDCHSINRNSRKHIKWILSIIVELCFSGDVVILERKWSAYFLIDFQFPCNSRVVVIRKALWVEYDFKVNILCMRSCVRAPTVMWKPIWLNSHDRPMSEFIYSAWDTEFALEAARFPLGSRFKTWVRILALNLFSFHMLYRLCWWIWPLATSCHKVGRSHWFTKFQLIP